MLQPELPRRAHLGLTLGEAKLSSSRGLLVRRVAPGSFAEQSDIRPGDRLLRVDEQPLLRLADARSLLRAVSSGQELRLELLRDDVIFTRSGTLPAFPLEQHVGARVVLGQVPFGPHRLRSIVLLPEGPGPYPVVYHLPAAHWASEEFPLSLEHPLPSLLGALARAGFASVRVERSGVGDSEGPACTRVGFEAELAAFDAGLEWTRRAAWARADAVFLFGHSVGAMVAPLLAAEREVRGLIAFGVGALRISDALLGAAQRYWQQHESDPERISVQLNALEQLIDWVVRGSLTPAQAFEQFPELEALVPSHFHGDEAYGRVIGFFQELERRELSAAWQRVRAPVLLVHGGADAIATLEDAQAIASHAPGAEISELEGVDHQMSDVELALRSQRALCLAPRFLERVQAWLLQQMAARRAG